MMELSNDCEFLAAALSALSGQLFLSTLVPGPNTKITRPFQLKYLWKTPESEVKYCDFNSWFLPHNSPEPIAKSMKTLYIKTLTGKSIQVSIDQSSYIFKLKEKILDKEGNPPPPPDCQKLISNGNFMRD